MGPLTIIQPGLRRLVLTAHVTTTVGWLGAIVVFLVPLAFASLLTGIVQSLGTRWGLLRHYWVLFKLLITAFATIVLLLYMPALSFMTDVAARTDDLSVVRNESPMDHTVLALVLLLAARDLQAAGHDHVTMARQALWSWEAHDRAWAQLAPLLPRNQSRGGRWCDHRTVINGIL